MPSHFRFQIVMLAVVVAPQYACAQRPVSGTESTITEDLIRRHVNVIAADSMLGRNTPSRGLDMTASYIAAQFKRLGLKPGGDSGTYIQRYPIAKSASAGSGPAVASDGFDPSSAPHAVGILPGSDPILRNEYIVVSAYMDHVGVNGANVKDSIWNGADDDASGTAGVLALAEAFALAPPKRSVIFLT